MDTSLFSKLERAVRDRNSALADRLRPGQTEAFIRKSLVRAGAIGCLDPVVALFSWKDGCDYDEALSHEKGSFFPAPEHYVFLPFELIVSDFKGLARLPKYNPRMQNIAGRYFPLFSNIKTRFLAVDLEDFSHSRIVLIDYEPNVEKPMLEVFPSFEGFILEMIRANRYNSELACFKFEFKNLEQSEAIDSVYKGNLVKSHPRISVKGNKSKYSDEKWSKICAGTENPLLIRTDFSNQEAWIEICRAIRESNKFFIANVEFIDDQGYDGLKGEELRRLIPKDYTHEFIIIVDRIAIQEPDHPLLIVDLLEGRQFRSLPSQIGGIENNLSTANMDFEEFAEAVDEDGIFRGFEWIE